MNRVCSVNIINPIVKPDQQRKGKLQDVQVEELPIDDEEPPSAADIKGKRKAPPT